MRHRREPQGGRDEGQGAVGPARSTPIASAARESDRTGRETYIGDSVYASYTGSRIQLRHAVTGGSVFIGISEWNRLVDVAASRWNLRSNGKAEV